MRVSSDRGGTASPRDPDHDLRLREGVGGGGTGEKSVGGGTTTVSPCRSWVDRGSPENKSVGGPRTGYGVGTRTEDRVYRGPENSDDPLGFQPPGYRTGGPRGGVRTCPATPDRPGTGRDVDVGARSREWGKGRS